MEEQPRNQQADPDHVSDKPMHNPSRSSLIPDRGCALAASGGVGLTGALSRVDTEYLHSETDFFQCASRTESAILYNTVIINAPMAQTPRTIVVSGSVGV